MVEQGVDVLRVLLLLLFCVVIQGCVSQERQAELDEKAKKMAKASDLNVQLGIGYLRQGNMQRAKSKLMLALDEAPNSLDALGAMAYYFDKVGEKDRAQQYYLKALRASHGKGAQLNNYGAFLCREGKYLEATEYFLQASKDIDYLNTGGALENAGLCSLEIPNKDLAVTYFEKALEQDPKRFQSLYRLAKIAYDKKQYQKCLDQIKRYQGGSELRPQILWLAYQASLDLGDTKQANEYAWIIKKRFADSNEFKLLEASNRKHDNIKRNIS